MNHLILGFLCISAVLPLSVNAAYADTHGPAPLGATVGQAIDQLTTLTQMREGLAASLINRPADEPITAETFQQVCAPVGKALKSWATQNGVEAQQWAVRFRNPKNEATGTVAKLIRAWEKDPSQHTAVFSMERDGKPGLQVIQRIPVTEGCLKCHGAATARPEFIQKNYPDDRAHGFKAGDLRAVFGVWIPKK